MLLRSSGMFSNVALVLFTVFGAFARQRKLRARARAPAHQRRSFSMSLASQPSPCRAVAAAVCFARHTMTICMCVCFTYIRVLQTHSIETCKTSSGRQRDQRTGGRVQQLQFLRRPRRLAAAFYSRVCVLVCVCVCALKSARRYSDNRSACVAFRGRTYALSTHHHWPR